METCTLNIIDEVNVKFDNLNPFIRRKICETLKFMVPYARHMPSFKLGRWDGKKAFATVGGGTYYNLLDRVLPIVIEAGYEIEVDDRRPTTAFTFPAISETLLAHTSWPEGHPAAGQPIMLRDYQVAAIERYLANPQSIQSISTGAGKTILSASLSYLAQPFGRSLVIVPSKSLVEQTEEDFRNVGLDCGVYFGDRKELGHTHTIATWQSLSAAYKSAMDGDSATMEAIVRDLVCVQVDECHSAKADMLRDLLAGPLARVPLRWGLTGTVPKEDFEFLTLLSTIGPVVGEIRAVDLQEQGVLARCEVEVMQLDDSHVEYTAWDQEYDFLTSDQTRLAYIAERCKAFGEDGNTLILVERIECGKFLQAHIPGSVFINGAVNNKNRKKEYKEVQVAQNKVIIATYGVAAVGINIPRIFNLVLIEAGKSFTRVIQSVGRGIRVAQDKDFVQIYDICSNRKFSSRHLTMRKTFYADAEYPYRINKVAYR